MKSSILSLVLGAWCVTAIAGAAAPPRPEPLPHRHILVQADYLPDSPLESQALEEPIRQWDEGEDVHSAPAFGSPARSMSSEPPANDASRENAAAGMSPPPLQVFAVPENEFTLQHDPGVAVSPHFVVAYEAHALVFYDKKTGKRLPQTTGIPTALGSRDLFRPFMAPSLDGRYDPATGRLVGTPNPNNVNNFAELPRDACVLTDKNRQIGCMAEVFDLRTIYDAERHRFIFAGTVRRSKTRDLPDLMPVIDGKKVSVAREMTLIAVTRDEDPRNGFHEYLFTEGGDWPRIAVDDRVLTLTTWDGKIVLQFSADDLARGTKQPAMARWNAHEKQNWPFRGLVYNVASRPPWSGYSWLIQQRNSTDQFITLYAIRGVGGKITTVQIPIRDAANHPLNSAHDWWTDPVLRNGKLYIATTDAMREGMVVRNGVDAVTGQKPLFWCRPYDNTAADEGTGLFVSVTPSTDARTRELVKSAAPCRIRLLGFALDMKPDGITGVNQVDIVFGHAASDDPPGSMLSYLLPALDVTSKGAVVMTYMRSQYNVLGDSSKEISPEARYSVFYPNEKMVRHSRLLHRGTGMPPHPNLADAHPPVRGGNFFLDLAQVMVDEDDIAWMANGYASDRSRFQEVVAAVKP